MDKRIAAIRKYTFLQIVLLVLSIQVSTSVIDSVQSFRWIERNLFTHRVLLAAKGGNKWGSLTSHDRDNIWGMLIDTPSCEPLFSQFASTIAKWGDAKQILLIPGVGELVVQALREDDPRLTWHRQVIEDLKKKGTECYVCRIGLRGSANPTGNFALGYSHPSDEYTLVFLKDDHYGWTARKSEDADPVTALSLQEDVLRGSEWRFNVLESDPFQAYRQIRNRIRNRHAQLPLLNLTVSLDAFFVGIASLTCLLQFLLCSNLRIVTSMAASDRKEPWVMLDALLPAHNSWFNQLVRFTEFIGGTITSVIAALTPLIVGSVFVYTMFRRNVEHYTSTFEGPVVSVILISSLGAIAVTSCLWSFAKILYRSLTSDVQASRTSKDITQQGAPPDKE